MSLNRVLEPIVTKDSRSRRNVRISIPVESIEIDGEVDQETEVGRVVMK